MDESVHHVRYPDGVEPTTVAGRVHGFSLFYLGCKQATHGPDVSYGVQLFTFGGHINPPDSTTANLTAAYYLLEAYTNSRSLVENASNVYGLDLKHVESIALEKVPLNPPPYPSFAYTLAVPSGPQPDYSLRGQMWEGTPTPHQRTYGFYFTTSEGHLNHFRLAYEGDSRSSFAGVGTFGPNSYWGQYFDVDAWDLVNLPYTGVTANLAFQEGA